MTPTTQVSWTFERFSNNQQTACDACGHRLRNVFIIRETGGGFAEVGVECLKHTLPNTEIVRALKEFRRATWLPTQRHTKSRIEKIQRKVPPQVLQVWTVEVKGQPTRVQAFFADLCNKIDSLTVLADWELEALDRLEALIR